jgi:hypothetical protein
LIVEQLTGFHNRFWYLDNIIVDYFGSIVNRINRKHSKMKGGVLLLYRRIKAICDHLGITIAYLEKKAGISNGSIDGWDTGSPTIKSLKKVADVLGMSVDKLIEGIDFTDKEGS